MIDKDKPLFSLTVGEYLELQCLKNTHYPPSVISEYFTVDDACKYLNVAKPTLYAYTSKRLIPFIKQNRKLLFVKKDLDRWLDSSKIATIKELHAMCNNTSR